METDYLIGKTKISNSEVEKQVSKILDILKQKKQTYAVNKFVLEETIRNLQEEII